MPDRSARRPDLRAPVPTLEPDDAFLTRLSALAAAGAPTTTTVARPVGAWRVGFAAVGVAAVLVGVAWLAGLSPGQSPSPAPPPASTPSAPGRTPAPPPSPTDRTTAEDAGALALPETELASATTFGPASSPVRPGLGHHGGATGAADPADAQIADAADGAGNDHPGLAKGKGHVKVNQGHGPKAHPGHQPNAHSSVKSNHGNPEPGTPPDRGKGGRSAR